MDEFELYMIDNMKFWGDKLRNENNCDIRWMDKNVLQELICVFVKYEGFNQGITLYDPIDFETQDETKNSEDTVDLSKKLTA